MTATFTLTGRILDKAKTPVARASLVLASSTKVAVDPTANEVYSPTPRITTNDQGYLCVADAAGVPSDSAGVPLIVGVQYRLRSTNAGLLNPLVFTAPDAGQTLDLADVVPENPSPDQTWTVALADLAARLVALEDNPGGGGGLTEEQVTALVATGLDTLSAADVGAATPAQVNAAVASETSARTAAIASAVAGVSTGTTDLRWAKSWLAAFGNRLYGPVPVTVTGSSTVEGANATVSTRRAVTRMGQILQAAYNPAGVVGGFHAKFLDTGWGVTGGVTNTVAFGALGRRSYSIPNAGTLTRTDTCTGYQVQYAQGPGSGPFTIKIDGATLATITPDTTGAARSDGVWTSSVLTRASHTLLITATTATPAIIDGAYVIDGDNTAGIRVYDDGMGGAALSDFQTSGTTRFAQLAPGLIVLIPGATEFGANTPVATFKANLAALIAQRKAALTLPASFLIVGTFKRPDVTGRDWAPYLTAMQELAAADPTNIGYVDLSTQFPTDSTTGDPYNLLTDGDIHLTDRGHALLGDLLAGVLLDLTKTRPVSGASPVVSVTPYTPADMPGLLAWYRPSSIAQAADTAVAAWPDSSPNAYTATQATAGSRPTYKTAGINAKPAVSFDGTDHLISSLPADTEPFTLCAVVAPTLTGSRTILGTQQTGGMQVRLAGATAGTYVTVLLKQGVGVMAQQSAGVAFTTGVVVVTWDGTAVQMRINGAVVATGAVTDQTFTAAALSVIGARDTANGDPYTGLMGDVVKATGVKTLTQIQAFEQWAASEYGITLA